MREMRPEKRGYRKENTAGELLLGIILLGIGLFMLSQRAYVHANWGMIRIGSVNIASGLVTIPLIIGIVWQFYNPRSSVAKIVITLGVVIILVTLLMNMRISFMTISLYEYIIMFGFLAAGCGLVLRGILKSRK